MTGSTRGRCRRHLVVLAAMVCGTGLGCGGAATAPVPEMSVMLDRYERDRRRHDPVHFSEVDLGQYIATRRNEPTMVYVRFHAYAVVPNHLLGEFDELLQTHSKRIQSRIREVAQKVDDEPLADPSLSWFKSELTSEINRELCVPIVRDVAFATFSVERG